MCFSLADQILLLTWDLDLSHRNAPDIIVCDWLLTYPTRGGGYFLIRGYGEVPLDGVAFSRLDMNIRGREWGRTISNFWGRKFFIFTVSKPECLYCRWKVKCSSFKLKNGSIHFRKEYINGKWLRWDRENYICPKVTKMGSIIGHGIDCNGVGALRGQRHIPSKN